MRYLTIFLLLAFTTKAGFAQKNTVLKGEWIQIRAESNGSIFYIDSATNNIYRHETWMLLDFENPDTVCMSDLNVFTRSSFFRTSLTHLDGNTGFRGKRFYSDKYFDCEILQQTDSMLALKATWPDRKDKAVKMYLVPRQTFDRSTPEEKAIMTGPWERDYAVYNSLLPLSKGIIFNMTEQRPEYPFFSNEPTQGSKVVAAIKDSLSSKNISYPEDMKISAVIELTGKLSHITIAENNNKELLDNVIQVLNSMKRWRPAKQNGVAVRCMIHFDLKNNTVN